MEKSEKIEKTSHVRGLEIEYTPHATGMGLDKKLFSRETNADVELLYDVVRASPEVAACASALVEDIMADEWRFVGSKDAKKKSDRFVLESNFYKILTNAILDLIFTGDAYILKLAVNEDKMKTICNKLSQTLAKTLKVNINQKTVYELVEQEIKVPKDLQLLKSSTMKINFDETGKVLSYEQQVHGIKRIYRPKDIIHLSLYNIGGQPYGFTPIESAMSDMATLIFAKEFAGKYFENDGIPYFIFKMPDASPDDRNYKNLVQELKNMKKEANKYRSMVITGNVEAEQVNKFNKDMEFSKLIQHFTQIVLMFMGVPAHRVNLTIDVRQVGGAVNRAYEGYYKKLSFMQKVLENSLNLELWDAFKTEMKFNRVYKIDEMREAQVIQILTQAQLVTVEEAREMMGLEPELPKGTMPQSTSPVFGSAETDTKRPKENENQEPKPKVDNKLKVAKSMDFEVSYIDFVKIVEGKIGAGEFDKANVLYMETMDEFILFFSDEFREYKTRVKKTEIDVESFKLEKLRNAIKVR
jgi:HK97 family phage portal protein